jgi:transcriptional regulator with XRE-family HTH domain
MNTIAERIAWARLKSGLACSSLDEMAGLSVGHVAKIESGARGAPSAETVSAIAKALGVPVGWLIDGGRLPAIKSP